MPLAGWAHASGWLVHVPMLFCTADESEQTDSATLQLCHLRHSETVTSQLSHANESQPYPGLHQQQVVSRSKEVIPPLCSAVLCSGKTPPGVLHPALEPSAQERHGSVGVEPEEGHKNDPRGGAPLLWGQAQRVGVVQPGEEKTPRRPCSISVLKGGLEQRWGQTF